MKRSREVQAINRFFEARSQYDKEVGMSLWKFYALVGLTEFWWKLHNWLQKRGW